MNAETNTTAASVYLRVSTDAQDTENQLHGISQYAQNRGMKLGETIHDTASGKTPWQDRLIGKLLKEAPAGTVILVSEVSRLARSTLQVLEIMQQAAERGLVIHVAKNALILDGSMQSKITSTILGLAAEIERDFISARTTEALAARRAAGLPMGRPKGEADTLALDSKAAKLDEWHAAGLGKRSLAKLANCSPSTIYLWIERRRPEWIK